MMKKFITLLLIIPLLAFCGKKEEVVPDPDTTEEQKPDDPKPDDPTPDPDPQPDPEPQPEDPSLYDDAAPEVKDGDEVQATNPLVEKFLTEVDYEDQTCTKSTKVLDYYGGFNGTELNWDTWKKDWPDGDKPEKYSIRWKQADIVEGEVMNLHLEDKLGWKGDLEIAAGSCYIDITNLVPGDQYTYSVTSAGGKELTKGTFTTKAGCTLHQVFFTGLSKKLEAKNGKGSGVRNGRDLGGWPTLSGKTVKYRKLYRGGRMNDPWETMLNKQGKKEVVFEGIGAQIDLRGSDDVVKKPAVDGLDHCAPVIEEGGKVMLGVSKPSNYNCAKWLAFDVQREDMKSKSKDELKNYTPTAEELEAFQVAYRAKTKQLFDFVLASVKANKPVYFHCSLGRDRTGTLDIILLGVLGVREGIIAKEYEVTYFAPVGYSVSSSDKGTNPEPIFKNTRMAWVYSDIVPYFWDLAKTKGDGTFASGVEYYLVNIAGVAQADINEFRNLMLE